MQAIIVNGTLEEIAALVLAVQGQQAGKLSEGAMEGATRKGETFGLRSQYIERH